MLSVVIARLLLMSSVIMNFWILSVLIYTLHFSALSLDSLFTVCACSLKYVMILWQRIFGVSGTEEEKRTIKSEEFWRHEPRAFGFRLVLVGLQVTIISSCVHV